MKHFGILLNRGARDTIAKALATAAAGYRLRVNPFPVADNLAVSSTASKNLVVLGFSRNSRAVWRAMVDCWLCQVQIWTMIQVCFGWDVKLGLLSEVLWKLCEVARFRSSQHSFCPQNIFFSVKTDCFYAYYFATDNALF